MPRWKRGAIIGMLVGVALLVPFGLPVYLISAAASFIAGHGLMAGVAVLAVDILLPMLLAALLGGIVGLVVGSIMDKIKG